MSCPSDRCGKCPFLLTRVFLSSLFIGTLFSMIGGALQAAAQSSDFILVARVVTGIGTGALTGITPVLISETSTAQHRGEYMESAAYIH